MTPNPPRTPSRLSSIDALRGVAALMVVLFHARELAWVGLRRAWQLNGTALDPLAWAGYLTAPLAVGYLGVTLFFVLSGYCIHRSHLRSLARQESAPWRVYFLRRFFRIYPVLLAALAVTALCDATTRAAFPHQYKLGDDSIRSALINAATLQNIAGPTYGSNIALWTLSIEIHFYLLYPLLFWISRRYSANAALLLPLATSAVYLLLVRSPVAIFIPFWFTWALGFWVAEWEAGRTQLPKVSQASARLFAVLLVITAVALIATDRKEAGEFFVGIFMAGGLMWTVSRDTPAPSRGVRLLAWFGTFSYSIYAIHLPVLVLLRATLLQDQPSTNILVTLLLSIMSLVPAWLLFKTVESWSIRKSQEAGTANRSRFKSPALASIR